MEAQVQDVSVLDQIRAFLDQILLWLETITGVFADIDGMLENLLSIAENSEGIIEVLFSIGTFIVDNIGAIFIGLVVIVNCIVAIFMAIVSILTAIITAAGLVGVIIGGIATVIIAVLTYLFTAFPYYRLGKKAGVKCAWLAWMPIPGLDYYCRLYVLSQIPGEKPVTVFGDKFTIPDRFLVFWACIGIRFLGTTLITMLVTVLYRIDGSAPVSNAERACFDDIAGAYYTDAVAWAYANGIVNGVDKDTFAPDRIVTRQEAVTIFYRYCVEYNLTGVNAGLELDGFADQNKVAGFATDAFAWAVDTGLVEGSAGTNGLCLNPGDHLNRAQAAILLQRGVEDIM